MKSVPSKRIAEGMRILFQFFPLSTYGGVPEDVPPPRPPRGDGIQAGMRSKLMEEVEMDLENSWFINCCICCEVLMNR